MITIKRLEELIKQGATIYWIYGKSIEKKLLKHKYHKFFIVDNELNEYNAKQGIGIWKHKLSKLFETKEDAEWFLEFGNIVKPCKLDLPKWEDIKKDDKFHYIRHYNVNKSCFFIEIYKFTNTIEIYWHEGVLKTDKSYKNTWSLTKENYIKACRKAKELFLGEKSDVEDN